ncbi:MAG: GNAT family N-acetyltransferase [Actinobacteria bacterium]|nr:GNAT family N-acetyltransferase [Actinomycetota bacterium]
MNYHIDNFVLRRPEPADIKALYHYKNDPEIAEMLGGFSTGYSIDDIRDWIEFHRQSKDEVLWVIAEVENNRCIGHVGLYKIDHRIRSAEFAIMIGDRSFLNRGLGRSCTKFALDYAFQMLNLNRIYLTVLSTNNPASNLYRSLGFQEEGRLRQAQYKNGQYIDVLVMGLLRAEYLGHGNKSI